MRKSVAIVAYALLMNSGAAVGTNAAGRSAAESSGQAVPSGGAAAVDTDSTTGMAHDGIDPLTLDMDKDGYVTQAEAQRMVDSGKMDFNAMDADRDGRISAAEGKSFSSAARQSNQPGQAGQAGAPGETTRKGY